MSLLGATSIGGHPGILSLKDDSDLDKRDIRIREIALNWQRLFEVIEPLGIKTILWEPMSISREIGHTIEDAAYFQDILDKVGGSHFKICLDLDHGDLESPNKDDINPLAWIRAFRNQIGALHLKQTSIDRRKHMPFTPANNAIGTVNAKHIMSALSENAVKSITMYLELGFRERNPDDKKAIEDTKLSVEYWKQSGAQVN
jgi:sugar phosphate isomerase/epimerase